MTISTVNMNTLMNTLPVELLEHIGSFFLGRELRQLSLIFRSVWDRRENIMTPLVRIEQRRMEMQIVPFRVQLDFDDVVAHWRQLVPDVDIAVRNALNRQPLVFCSGLFDSATALIANSTLDARDDSQRMHNLAIAETDIGRAVIFARSIPDDTFRSSALYTLALRDTTPFEITCDLARSIPDDTLRSSAFYTLALRDITPLYRNNTPE